MLFKKLSSKYHANYWSIRNTWFQVIGLGMNPALTQNDQTTGILEKLLKTRLYVLAILLYAGFALDAYGQNTMELSHWDAGLSGGGVARWRKPGISRGVFREAYVANSGNCA